MIPVREMRVVKALPAGAALTLTGENGVEHRFRLSEIDAAALSGALRAITRYGSPSILRADRDALVRACEILPGETA